MLKLAVKYPPAKARLEKKKYNSPFSFFPFSAPKPNSMIPLEASSRLGSRRWAPVNSPYKGFRSL